MNALTIDERLAVIIGELLDGGIPLKVAKKVFEDKYIVLAIGRFPHGNKTKASRLLGIHRNSVHNKTRRMERFMESGRKR